MEYNVQIQSLIWGQRAVFEPLTHGGREKVGEAAGEIE